MKTLQQKVRQKHAEAHTLFTTAFDTKQLHLIQYNAKQLHKFDAILLQLIRYNATASDEIQCDTTSFDTKQCNTIAFNTIQCNTIAFDTKQCNYNCIQYDTTVHTVDILLNGHKYNTHLLWLSHKNVKAHIYAAICTHTRITQAYTTSKLYLYNCLYNRLSIHLSNCVLRTFSWSLHSDHNNRGSNLYPPPC